MNIQDAISKVRKLLALSKSQNINEAALAASKAAAIMQEYCIEEAALHTPDSFSDEPVNSYIFETDKPSRKKIRWRMQIATGCAKVFGCESYWQYGYLISLIGRESDVQGARYLFDLIAPQVEQLADEQWNRVGQFNSYDKRSWMHAFRLGCASTVRERMELQVAERMSKLREEARENQKLLSWGESSNALMVINSRLLKVDQFMGSLNLKPSRKASISDVSGYHSGLRAGHKVNIGGQAKAGLNAPARMFKV